MTTVALLVCGGAVRARGVETSPQERAKTEPLTLARIRATPDEKLVQVLLDHCVAELGDFKDEVKTVKSWPKGLRAFYAVTTLENELNNGGFDQYFLNAAGKFSGEALAGLKLIGAKKHQELLEKAIEIHDKRAKIADPSKEEQEDPYGSLDKAFYTLEGLEKPLITYIRKHPGDFVRKPQ